MGWESINLNDIEQSKGTFAPLPAGRYTMRLLGAKPDNYRDNVTAFDIVVDDGEYKGRRLFPTLPVPPNKDYWSAQAAAKFMKVLGIEQQPGEGVIELFNRAAQNGHSRFAASTTLRNYTKKDGTAAQDADLQWFSVEVTA